MHNLDICTALPTYHDDSIDRDLPPHPTSLPEITVEQTKPVAITAPPYSAPESNLTTGASHTTSPNKTVTQPPMKFPPNSSGAPIFSINDCPGMQSHLLSSNKENSTEPVSAPTNPATPGDEAYNMRHTKYSGGLDVDEINKNVSKKYNNTKEAKNVTKPPVVIDSKKDSKIDYNANETIASPPEINTNKTSAVEYRNTTEIKPIPDSKNKTNVAVRKSEEVHKGEATLIVTESPNREPVHAEEPQKSTSTLREIGKTLAAIMVTIVGTASMLFVGFVMWRRISRRYYGHREMLINEDDFEEVSDLHHFEGTTDTPPSQTTISQR